MALKATVFKATIQVSDLSRHYYNTHDLVIARHPSETTQRMMYRIISFIHNASDNLAFTKGLSTQEEPDLWQKSDSGEIELWIELGQPDEKRLKKAASLSHQVCIYTLQNQTYEQWFKQVQATLSKQDNIKVFALNPETLDALEATLDRTMNWTATLEDHLIWLSINNGSEDVSLEAQLQQMWPSV